jgi:hypothetical protein
MREKTRPQETVLPERKQEQPQVAELECFRTTPRRIPLFAANTLGVWQFNNSK